jgi:hypothetical protein
VRALGYEIAGELRFPDHHPYPQAGLERIAAAWKASGAAGVAGPGPRHRPHHRQGPRQAPRPPRRSPGRASRPRRARARLLALARRRGGSSPAAGVLRLA